MLSNVVARTGSKMGVLGRPINNLSVGIDVGNQCPDIHIDTQGNIDLETTADRNVTVRSRGLASPRTGSAACTL